MFKSCKRFHKGEVSGFTLAEMVIVIIMLSILMIVVIPKVRQNFLTSSRETAAEKELLELAKAIVGDPQEGYLGYLNEVGSYPASLKALYDSTGASAYNPFTRTGWNGPYVELRSSDVTDPEDASEKLPEIRVDPWGNIYKYHAGNRTIYSFGPDGQDDSGGDDDI